ncbi:MAG: polysaccharide biosynthesis protein [Sphingosinicella sp.]|nr:polysaccharide biosynthesis protein [Sphingosinicella sp.]
MIAAVLLWLPIAYFRGVYRAIFRVAGAGTMIGLARACGLLAAPLTLLFVLFPVPDLPRTISVLQPLIFFVLLCLSRITARYLFIEVRGQRLYDGVQKRVLIYGAGAAGQQLAASIRHEPSMSLSAYIDDDGRLDGQVLDGIPIYHSAKLGRTVERLEISDVLLAIPAAGRSKRKKIVRGLEDYPVHVQTLPNMRAIMDGRVSINDLRELKVEDLLGRDPVAPNQLLLGRTIVGKTVLVTGAGGSIGGELCRQIIKLQPKTLILLEMSEYALYSIEQELREQLSENQFSNPPEILPYIANATDASRIRTIFARCQPATVFHAAAYKHVPLVEANPTEGLRNNVVGTLIAAKEAERAGVKNFILISTDKAVRPTNIMGASKRLCELILQALAARGSTTKFAMVRFGNVLGSSGSVVPQFERQIQAGGPITLTHKDITRYFMTIPEAAQLVIQSGAMAIGGEVYVLDMGTPVKISELAKTMVRLAGLTVRDAEHPDGDIEIVEIGLRQGEKLYEELLIGGNPQPTKHQRIMRADEAFIPWGELEERLQRLQLALQDGDELQAIALLSDAVPEFKPQTATLTAKSA